jgi:hypothetical protein
VTLPGAAVRQIIDTLHLAPDSQLRPAVGLAPEVQADAETLRQWIKADD